MIPVGFVARRGKLALNDFGVASMSFGFWTSLFAIGLASLLGARHASAGSLVEFPDISEQAPKLVGYLARPDRGLSALLGAGGGGFKVVQYPAVVVLACWRGRSRRSAGVADRLGSWGYVALAVDSLGPRGIADRLPAAGIRNRRSTL